jgi:hypothetical protein
MARPQTIRGTYVTILMGNGADPQVFAILCGITAKTFTDAIGTADEFTRDCADPEEVPVRELILTGRSWSISGSGVLNRTQFDDLETAMGQYKDFRFFIGEPDDATLLNGYYGGQGVITDKAIRGDDGGNAGIDITIQSNGVWAWVDVPHA